MSISEITEENDEDAPPSIDQEAQKERIRRILEYQKSLYFSSFSSSSSSVSSSSTSFSSSRKRSSLLELTKGGSTCLRRLFDMEHTSLATHFEDYSASPIIKPIPLWGSDSDHDEYDRDPWAPVKQFGPNGQNKSASECWFMDGELDFGIRKSKTSNRMLKRKKSFRRLPGFGLWRCRGFRFRLKLKRLRIMICGRKF